MTSELHTFIAERRSRLQSELEAIRAQAEPIQAELRELKRAEMALGRGKAGRKQGWRADAKMPSRESIQGLTLIMLSEATEGLSVLQVVDGLSLRGRDAPRTSVAPQLSRLLAQGRVSRNDGVYRITEAGRSALSHAQQGERDA